MANLPVDILDAIGTYLSIVDLTRLLSTSKRLNTIPLTQVCGQNIQNQIIRSILKDDCAQFHSLFLKIRLALIGADVIKIAVKLMISRNSNMYFVRLLCRHIQYSNRKIEPFRDFDRLVEDLCARQAIETVVYSKEVATWIYESKTREEFLELDEYFRWPLLFVAIECNNIPMIETVLDSKSRSREEIINEIAHDYPAPAGHCYHYANFPIYLACALGFKEIVKFLLDNGAEVEHQMQEYSNTALDWTDRKDIIDLLQEAIRQKKIREMKKNLEQFRNGKRHVFWNTWTLLLEFATMAEFEEVVQGCDLIWIERVNWEKQPRDNIEKLKLVLQRPDLPMHFKPRYSEFLNRLEKEASAPE